MKKKSGKKIIERKTNVKSKNLKQKIKQVVNVNIHTGRRGKGNKPSPLANRGDSGIKRHEGLAAPYFAPSFNLSSSVPVSVPQQTATTKPINETNLEIIKLLDLINKEKKLSPDLSKTQSGFKKEEKVNKENLPFNKSLDETPSNVKSVPSEPLEESKPRRGRPRYTEEQKAIAEQKRKERAEKKKQQTETFDAIGYSTDIYPVMNVEAENVKIARKKNPKIQEAEEDRQPRISEFFKGGNEKK
jgi:hypothetical protein